MVSRMVSATLVSVTALVGAACAGGSDETEPVRPAEVTTTTDEPFTTGTPSSDAPAPTTVPTFTDGPLIDVCGDTIVVQASDFPLVGNGPLYALLGVAPTIDLDRQTVSAPLTRADGTVEDVTLEIRSGGPAVGFRSAVDLMAVDDSIDMALASTADAVRDRTTLATTAVMSLTDRSSDAVIIDPVTYPSVTDLATLGAQDIEVRHVTDAPVIQFLTETGVLSADQLTPGSDELPASFVEAEGTLAQQGDVTVEPALLPVLPQWGRPVIALAASESGWASLDDMLVVDAEAERLSDECLGRLVPVVQRAIIDYLDDPTPTNALMSEVRAQFNPLERLTAELLNAGTRLAVEAGVFDLDRPDAPGTIETGRLAVFLGELASATGAVPVAVDDLVDDRFIDTTISR